MIVLDLYHIMYYEMTQQIYSVGLRHLLICICIWILLVAPMAQVEPRMLFGMFIQLVTRMTNPEVTNYNVTHFI